MISCYFITTFWTYNGSSAYLRCSHWPNCSPSLSKIPLVWSSGDKSGVMSIGRSLSQCDSCDLFPSYNGWSQSGLSLLEHLLFTFTLDRARVSSQLLDYSLDVSASHSLLFRILISSAYRFRYDLISPENVFTNSKIGGFKSQSYVPGCICVFMCVYVYICVLVCLYVCIIWVVFFLRVHMCMCIYIYVFFWVIYVFV